MSGIVATLSVTVSGNRGVCNVYRREGSFYDGCFFLERSQLVICNALSFLMLQLRLAGDKSLFVALAISLVLFSLVLVEPLGSAQAVLQSMALDLVRYGRIPYISSWDNNFPGIVFLHTIGIILLGESSIAFRIFVILIELC